MQGHAYKISPITKNVFEFTSTGNKQLVNRVSFDEIIEGSGIYNMGLGTVLEDGSINYNDSTNNGDVVKVFSTVINCVKIFVLNYPERIIFFKGNTEQKNRVYNEIIRRYYDEFSMDFHIFGAIHVDDQVEFHNFDISMNYSGFYLKLKS